jgi:predicted amidohydrolase
MLDNTNRVALIQHGPEYWDLEKSLQKAKSLLEETAANGAKLAVFGECWLTGYPAYLDYCPEAAYWNHEPVKTAWANMFENSIEIPGKELEMIKTWCKSLNINLVMGVNEKIVRGRGNGTLYNSIIMINNEGELLNHHRKLMPTYTERMVHGLGDGKGLKSIDTNCGRISALICWEHWMPLARQAMHDSGEDIHIALWPMVREMHQIASRQYAFEGRCYVLAVGQIMKVKDFPSGIDLPAEDKSHPENWIMKGGSCAYGPDGEILLEPQEEKEAIFYLDLPNRFTALKEKMNLAVSGHYQRWDVFDFAVNRNRPSDKK